jgi:DNA repair exonuclease SbcCD ATPase subunit
MRIKTIKEANAVIEKLNKEVEYLTSENKQINGLLEEIEKLTNDKEYMNKMLEDVYIKLSLAESLLRADMLNSYYKIKNTDVFDDLKDNITEVKESINFNTIQEYMENKYPNLEENLANKISDLNKIYLEELKDNADAYKQSHYSKNCVPIKRIDEVKEIIVGIE